MPDWLSDVIGAISSTVSDLLLFINEHAPVSFWLGLLSSVTYWFRRSDLRKFWDRVERGAKSFPKLTWRERVGYPLTFPLLIPETLSRIVIGPERDRGGPRTLVATILALLLVVALGKLTVTLWQAFQRP